MEEGGRSRSSLSSIASSQRTLSADSRSSRRNSGTETDEQIGNPIHSWIDEVNRKHETCTHISKLEDIIDDYQVKIDECRKTITAKQGDRTTVKQNKELIQQYLKNVTTCESFMMKFGPCPNPDCSRHHSTERDVVMDEAGQYANYPLPKSPTPSPTNLTTPDGFRQVPPKKAARIQIEKPNSPIKINNRFENLMDISDIPNAEDTQTKIFVPDINLKLTDDYNLTVQEIARKFPATICKYQRGYIRMSPHSLEDRDKIIENLDKTEKEYVLSEPPESRPIKIVIKNLPPDHSKEHIVRDLEENKYKVIRINQLRNFRLKTLLPIFLVELAKTPNANNIFQVEKINNFSVKIEHYRKKQRATMCYRCSDFYHSARNCKCKPRCIKCNGTHETRSCSIKSKIDNPICINCNENGHLASWKGCPKYPVIK
ncbi:hypothetical protein AVEN_189494-1, partial [Araneus ventricosus]